MKARWNVAHNAVRSGEPANHVRRADIFVHELWSFPFHGRFVRLLSRFVLLRSCTRVYSFFVQNPESSKFKSEEDNCTKWLRYGFLGWPILWKLRHWFPFVPSRLAQDRSTMWSWSVLVWWVRELLRCEMRFLGRFSNESLRGSPLFRFPLPPAITWRLSIRTTRFWTKPKKESKTVWNAWPRRDLRLMRM